MVHGACACACVVYVYVYVCVCARARARAVSSPCLPRVGAWSSNVVASFDSLEACITRFSWCFVRDRLAAYLKSPMLNNVEHCSVLCVVLVHRLQLALCRSRSLHIVVLDEVAPERIEAAATN